MAGGQTHNVSEPLATIPTVDFWSTTASRLSAARAGSSPGWRIGGTRNRHPMILTGGPLYVAVTLLLPIYCGRNCAERRTNSEYQSCLLCARTDVNLDLTRILANFIYRGRNCPQIKCVLRLIRNGLDLREPSPRMIWPLRRSWTIFGPLEIWLILAELFGEVDGAEWEVFWPQPPPRFNAKLTAAENSVKRG